MEFTPVAMAALTHPVQMLLVAMLVAHLAPRAFRGARRSVHRLARRRVDEVTQRV